MNTKEFRAKVKSEIERLRKENEKNLNLGHKHQYLINCCKLQGIMFVMRLLGGLDK